jgi:hypothetical protein
MRITSLLLAAGSLEAKESSGTALSMVGLLVLRSIQTASSSILESTRDLFASA